MTRRSPRSDLVAATDVRDSGPACVATVLGALGRVTTLGEVRARCGGAGRASVGTLIQAGRSYGLEMVPLQIGRANLPDVPFPAVVLLEGRFVLLEGRRFGSCSVLDPVGGRRREVRDRQLIGAGDRTVLTVNPGPRFFRETGHVEDRGWRILLRQAARTPNFRVLIGAMIGLSLLGMAVGLTGPVLTAVLVDQVLPRRLPGVLGPIALGIGLLTLTTFLASLLRGQLMVLVSARLDDRLMTTLFAHMMALPYRFFRERTTGDLVQRFSSNAAIRTALTQQTVSGVLNIVQVLVYAAALLLIDLSFGVCALAIGVVQVAVLVLPARRIARLTRRELEQVANTQGFTVEVAAGAAYLKASGREGGMLRNWARRLHDQLEASMRRQRFVAATGAVTAAVGGSASAILLVFAVSRVLDGALTLGVALALLALASSFLSPLTSLIGSLQALQAVQAHVQRLATVLEEPVDQADRLLPPLPPLLGRIELRDVGFRYGPDGADGPWAVRAVSVEVGAGRRVAIVGGSGSGKSTLAGVLLGLHPPQEGRVLVDGLDLHEHDLNSFRRQCGVVLQDPVVFQGSVRDNVAFYDDEITDIEIERALRAAGLADDVARMPDGLHTLVGERGGTLSGGQRQRLALARALVGRPALLVLDEATSALDTVTEAAVNAHLRQVGVTTVVIAHRLSTVRDADLIVVLDGGRVVQCGTHGDLVDRPGRYRELAATDHAGLSAAPT